MGLARAAAALRGRAAALRGHGAALRGRAAALRGHGAALRGRAAALRAVAARHPRHLVLAALVGGLLAGPRPAVAVIAVAVAAALVVPGRMVAPAAAAAVLVGAGLADARIAALDRTALGPVMGDRVAVRATVLERPRPRSLGTRVAAVRLDEGVGRGERVLVRAPRRVRWPAAVPGAGLVVRGELAPLGPFDAFAARRHNAHAVLRAEAIVATGRRRGGVAGVLDGIRARTERALTTGIAPAQGALARGMVLGQDEALPAGLREDFRATGLAHLVAASGANVALLAALVLGLGTAAGLGLSARLAVALVVVAGYVPLAGGGPSIQRAGVMGAAGLVAALAGRPASRWYALLLAAGATLALNPRAPADAGWQLSFAAVLAMLAAVRPLSARLRRAGVPRGPAEAVAVTAAATLGTAPLIALHFDRVSLVSLPANVLAAPAVASVMWLGTVAGALGQAAPPAAEPVAALAALPLGYLTWLAATAAALPGAEVAVTGPSPAVVAALALAVAAGLAVLARRAAAARGPRARAARLAALAPGLVGAAALAVTLLHGAPAGPDHLRVSFLDIGQGDATLIQHGRATVLVDTGPPDGPILRRLREAGVRRIDVLVLTHAALDHDGAAGAVMGAYPVGLVLDGEEATTTAARPAGPFGARAPPPARLLAARHGVRRVASDAGQVLRDGPLELRVLWPHREPPAPPGAEPNDRATVLHVRDGAFGLLLTADAESNVTAGLDLPVADAMKVAHHGSDDPGTPGVLARVRPKVAVIPVGAHNSYGHPTPSTLAALRAVPIVRRTDRDGTVRLHVRDGRIGVEAGR